MGWWEELKYDLYKSAKYATPSELRRRANHEKDPFSKAKWNRMADRRKEAFDIYKMICQHIDDEGDIEELGEDNGKKE